MASNTDLHHEEAKRLLGASWDGSRFEFSIMGDTHYVEKIEVSDQPNGRRLWTFVVRRQRGGGIFDVLKEDWNAAVHLTYHNETGQLENWSVSLDTGETTNVRGLIDIEAKDPRAGVTVKIDLLGTLQAASDIFTGTGEKNEFATAVQHIMYRMIASLH